LSGKGGAHTVRKGDFASEFKHRAAHKLHGLESKPGNALHCGALGSPSRALALPALVGLAIAGHGVLCARQNRKLLSSILGQINSDAFSYFDFSNFKN
jgi:hypothetical protein